MFKINLANKNTDEESNIVIDNSQKEEHKETYDVIVVGAGGAGYTSAIYSARYNLKTLIIGEEFGGQMNIDYEVENYPGFRKIPGKDLMKKFEDHAKDLGVEQVLDKVEKIEKTENKSFKITTMFSIYYSHSIVLALGTKRRKLNVPGEKEFTAKGVSYCSTCDGAFFKDKIVAIIGGGDSAFASAYVLLQHVKKLYIIHRRDEFRAKPGVIDEIKNNPKIEFILNANVTEVIGDTKVSKIKTDNPDFQEVILDGIFIDIGVIPANDIAKQLNLDLDVSGYIKVNSRQETSIEGVFAAGDITTESNGVKQLVVAAAEGAIAAESAFSHTRKCKEKNEKGKCLD